MDIIVLVLDSLRQDHVSYYGWGGCPLKTPNLDAFATESVVFDNCYPEGLSMLLWSRPLLAGMKSDTRRPAWSLQRAMHNGSRRE